MNKLQNYFIKANIYSKKGTTTFMDYQQFLDKIIKSDGTIRSAIIFDEYGQIKDKAQRSDTELHLNEYDTEKLLRESASSWHYRKELSYKLGKGLYVLAEYENVKRITIPVDNKYLLLVTAENQNDKPKLVKNIQHVLEKEKS